MRLIAASGESRVAGDGVYPGGWVARLSLVESGEARRARNEVTFRAANERIARKAAALGADDQPVPFLCECPQPTCTDLVFLSLDEYTEIRAHPRQFLARPGHEGSGPGVLAVRSAGEYCVFEKNGVGGEIAETDAKGSASAQEA